MHPRIDVEKRGKSTTNAYHFKSDMPRIETGCYMGLDPPWEIIRKTLREGVGT